jgi:hypothetical protein
MPTKAKIYIAQSVVVACALLGGAVWGGTNFPDLVQFLVLASLACIGSMMKVRLPGLPANISVNFVFILMAVAGLTLAETLFLAIPATVVQCLWRPKTRPQAAQVLFSVSTVVIASAFSYWVAHLIPGGSDTIAALAPAATAYFVTNTGMVSVVISLISKERLRTKWTRCHLWTFPYYLAGASIAGLVVNSSRAAGWRLSLLALPSLFLVYAYYQEWVSKTISNNTPA